MKIAISSDYQIENFAVLGGTSRAGINRRCQLILDTLSRAAMRADQLADWFVGAGDIFENSDPTPTMVARAISALDGWPPRNRVMLIPGNHDRETELSDHHALAPFQRAGFDVVDKSTSTKIDEGVALWRVPFHRADIRQWLPEQLALLSGFEWPREQTILILHAGLIDPETPEHMRGAPDAIEVEALRCLMRLHRIDVVFSGHWHTHRAWVPAGVGAITIPDSSDGQVVSIPADVVQIGALCPAGFGDAAPFGGLLIYDTETRRTTRYDIPGPRFLTFVRTDEAAIEHVKAEHTFDLPLGEFEEMRGRGHQTHIRLVVPPGYTDIANDTIHDLVERGLIVAGDGEADKTAAQAAAREVAAKPLGQLDLRGALVEYVETTCSDVAQRPRVVQICAELLGV